jgi:hypothetical protein
VLASLPALVGAALDELAARGEDRGAAGAEERQP